MTYEPTLESVRRHAAPGWFHDAKLGIFIHWGLYSVPGWAPTTGPLPEVIATQGWQSWFSRNPYAEWYMNTMRVPGSPTAQHHAEQYGAGFPYSGFAKHFGEGLAGWRPDQWSELFQAAGARYVVLTTKHHDGFLLWPSRTPNPFIQGYHAERDLVGELTDAVRARGMRMGLYYSGGLDWTFNDRVIADIADLYRAVPQSPEYVAYADGHWRELIERYAPSVLWNDIGYPAGSDLPRLFAEYYNGVPEGVVNDRFLQPSQSAPDTDAIIEHGMNPSGAHFDFRTPEYAVFDEVREEKWESCRGLGFSFGYNRNEGPESMLSSEELVRSFVDIVSKNGNLLINVGPMGDGTIPQGQAERLLALGRWLEINGEAIYGTRPHTRAESVASDGTPVRFTQKGGALYAVLLGTPRSGRVAIEGLGAPAGGVALLGGGDVAWEESPGGLAVTLPDDLPDSPAHALRIR